MSPREPVNNYGLARLCGHFSQSVVLAGSFDDEGCSEGDIRNSNTAMTTTMPSLPPAVAVYQASFDRPSTSIKRKWTGRELDKRMDNSAYENGSLRQPREEPQSSANVGRKSSEKPTTRGRQSSLRHVKNSTEVLRQLSANPGNKDLAPDGTSGGREGRQFTVANVGNNGRIYLRYGWI